MGLKAILAGYRTRWKAARAQKRWDGSPRKRELDSERDLPPRPLTTAETSLLRWMLESTSEETRSYLPQLDGIKAVRSCTCGCPSIRLVVPVTAPLGVDRSRILCDLLGNTSKGELTGLLLFQAGGRLAELEAYSLDANILVSDHPEFAFPAIESLRTFEQEKANSEVEPPQ